MKGKETPSSMGGGKLVGSDKSGQAQESSADSPRPKALGVGEQLRAARQAKGLSVDDVSRMLKITPRQVEAIESDDWASFSCTTIIRGFVRNYARSLGLDAGPLVSVLADTQMPRAPELQLPKGTPVNLGPGSRGVGRDLAKVLAGLAVLLLAILAYFFAPENLLQSAISSLKSAVQPAETAVVAPAENASEAGAGPAGAAPASPATDAVPSAAGGPQAVLPAIPPVPVLSSTEAPVPATAADGQLKFAFNKPSWVEVRDGKGAVIFSGMNKAGTQQEISGQPPFSLVVGSASKVTLQYQGRAIDLAKHTRDDVARFTLE